VQTSILGNPDCPFGPFLEEGDTHCFEPLSSQGYETLSENHPNLDAWLADVRHVGFDVTPTMQGVPTLPAFIADVGGGNGKVLTDTSPNFAATTIDRVVSPYTLKVQPDVHSVAGLPRRTTIIVNGYAEDTFLEKLWPARFEVAASLAKLDCIFTAPDYSVFLQQPHAERLINIKRSLIFFELLQRFGARAIPTMHWTGLKDLQRWAHWINSHLSIGVIALDLQMLTGYLWLLVLEQLRAFVAMLDRPIHFVVTGPSTPARIGQVRSVLKSVSVISAGPLQAAIRHRRLNLTVFDRISRDDSALSPSKLFSLNLELMHKICLRPVGQTALLSQVRG